jgi:hypothetical protein
MAGWQALLCIDGPCQAGSRVVQLTEGNHAITTQYNADENGSFALGTLTIGSDGSVTSDAALLRYFEPGVNAAGNPMLTAKTATVTIHFNGYPGQFAINGGAHAHPQAPGVVLLKGRSYNLLALYTADLEGRPSLSSGYGLQLDSNGVVTLVLEVANLFDQSPPPGRDLTARVTEVVFDRRSMGPS